jgi:hypothetical protein
MPEDGLVDFTQAYIRKKDPIEERITLSCQ